MIDIKKLFITIGFISIFLLAYEQLNAQNCYRYKSRDPYFEIWGHPRIAKLNLLEMEKGSPWHFGFSVGLNIFDFTQITPSNQTVNIPNQGNIILDADIKSIKSGFNINIIADYRFHPNFSVRALPGIFFGSRKLTYYRRDTQTEVRSMMMSSNYIDVPILLKYSAMRYTNFRPYLVGGFNTRFNLSSKINLDAERYIGLKKVEPFAEIGFGFDFYLQYFRFSTEIKISKGLINSLNDKLPNINQFYRQALKSIQSNMLSISFHFEG